MAIGGLHFPHAFNPLARIYRESTDPRVRAAALQSIGKIQTVEAGEFLVMVLRQEAGDLREAAYAALAQMDNADVLPILRQHHEIETNPQCATRSASCCAVTERAPNTSDAIACHHAQAMHVGCAIDLPRPRVELELGRRRHRRITVRPACCCSRACSCPR